MRRPIAVLGLLLAAWALPSPTVAQAGGAGLAAAAPGKVVASTTWVAALARAAGADDVTVIAPATLPHPPDYDPRPSDLVAVAGARFVVMAPFDGFAARLREAAGSTAQMITITPVNAPDQIHAEVGRLGEAFGTRAAAAAFLKRFDAEYERLSAELKVAAGGRPRTAVAQTFMAPWAAFAGLELVGTYGPRPLQPAELAGLVAKAPAIVVENGHSERDGAPSAGRAIAAATGAREVSVVNFPADPDLLSVFRENARRLRAVLAAP